MQFGRGKDGCVFYGQDLPTYSFHVSTVQKTSSIYHEYYILFVIFFNGPDDLALPEAKASFRRALPRGL